MRYDEKEYLSQPDAGFEARCFVCGDVDTCVYHHTSYVPEETVATCRSCHYKIHYKDGYRDDLDPTNGGEDTKQKLRKKWERENE